MSEKQKRKKYLQKRLSVILKAYAGLKGKANRKNLSDFIEQKLAEILSYMENLPVKEKVQKKDKSLAGAVRKSPVVVLQPSAALTDELHKNTIKSLELKNATTIL